MIQKSDYKFLQGDALSVLKGMPDKSVQCCITSPPYYGLRDYGTSTWVGGDPNCPHYRTSKYSKNDITGHKAMAEVGQAVGDAVYKSVCPLCGAVREDMQIGLEESPEQYIQRLVDVFREVKRVLKDDGTLWVNIGDTYNTSSYHKTEESNGYGKQGTNRGSFENTVDRPTATCCKPKDLIGVPWMLAFALRNDGWWLRQDIIWDRPNPMPEPVKDRCTKAHEYVFLLSKSPTYLFNHEKMLEPANYDGRKDTVMKGSIKYKDSEYLQNGKTNTMSYKGHERWDFKVIDGYEEAVPVRNRRDVWHIPVSSYSGAHFATYPEELVLPCILAGSNEGDTILDPFNGSGTTGVVALKNGRKYVGIDLNDKYIKLSEERFDEIFFDKKPLVETKKDEQYERRFRGLDI